MNMGAFPSGQCGQTVNLLLNASVVRIHQLPPKKIRNLGCGSFFVLELVGFEQVGRPQAAKNSPAGCFLDRGLRIHQLPPKGCGKNVVTAFFLCCIAENLRPYQPIFKARFTVLSNRFRTVGLFCLRILTACPLPCGLIFNFFQENFRFLCCFQNVFNFPAANFSLAAGIFCFSRQFSVCFQVFHFLPLYNKEARLSNEYYHWHRPRLLRHTL